MLIISMEEDLTRNAHARAILQIHNRSRSLTKCKGSLLETRLECLTQLLTLFSSKIQFPKSDKDMQIAS